MALPNSKFLDGECNVTVASWINPAMSDDSTHQLLGSGDSRGGFDPISLQFRQNKPYNFGFEDTVGNVAIKVDPSAFPITFENNRWYHLAVALKSSGGGSVIQVYVDGSAVYETNVSSAVCIKYDREMPTQIGAIHGFQQWNGMIDDTRIYNRALSPSEIQQLCFYEAGHSVALLKAVKPSFANLLIGVNYQLQVPGDLNNWTNHGLAFAATNTTAVYPQYWDVDNWGKLFFRLQVAP